MRPLMKTLVGATFVAGLLTSTAAFAADVECGLGNGVKAEGEPIKLGAIVGETGPDDFSSTADAAGAYFDCVNANGGINGRPIEYIVEDDQWNPEVAAQAAKKLIDDENVLLMVASASFVEATVNARTYEDRNIVVVPSACATSECFEAKNMSSTNAGPAPANVSAAQWAVENLESNHVACIALNIPSNGGWSCDLVAEGLELMGKKGSSVLLDPAGADFTSVVLEALATGADTFLLNLPAGVAIGVLKAAEEQDLASQVKFVSAAPLYDESVPEAIGPYWNNRLWIDIELTPLNSTGEDNSRWRKVMAKYGVGHPIDTFSQAGFLAANIIVDTMLDMDPSNISRETISQRVRAIKAYETDMTCTPWYFGPGDRHISLHTGQMVVVADGGFNVVNDCFAPKGPYFQELYDLELKEGLGVHAK